MSKMKEEKLWQKSATEKKTSQEFADCTDIVKWLVTEYEGRYEEYPTFFEQGASCYKRGKKAEFQRSLDNKEGKLGALYYFAYIKFFIDENEKTRALVAGKSGSENVNSTGCDLSFSEWPADEKAAKAYREKHPKAGMAREWLYKNHLHWYETKILIIRPDVVGKASEDEALRIEKRLAEVFGLFGS